jgi:flagella basal body P-ring formation protein FlgA
VPLEVKVIGPVLVAKQAIPAGSELQLAQFNLEEKNWTALSFSPNNLPARDEQLFDRQLSSALNPGQILRQEQLRAKPLINTGNPVRIQLLAGSVTISADGKALGAGMLGQTVRVQTEQGKTLMGVIKNEREVEVNLKNL